MKMIPTPPTPAGPRRRFPRFAPLLALCCALLLVLAPAACMRADAPTASRNDAPADISARLHAFLVETGTPGVAVAALRDDPAHGGDAAEPQIWAVGLADATARTPMTPTTLFCIGSVTKVFTAALTMELVEQGRLGLDDRLGALLPDLIAGTDPATSEVTVRQLLEHASGLPDFLNVPEVQADLATAFAPEELLRLALALPRSSAPGERFEYSNTNYLILGLILERRTGQSYDDLLRGLTKALDMADTRPGDDASDPAKLAHGYTRPDAAPESDGGNAGDAIEPAIRASRVTARASGGLISRPDEFVKLLRLPRVLRPEILTSMTREAPDAPPRPKGFALTPSGPYFEMSYSPGFELVRLDHADTPLVCKNGSFPGYASWYVWLPEKHLALAASCNNEKALLDLFRLLADLARDW